MQLVFYVIIFSLFLCNGSYSTVKGQDLEKLPSLSLQTQILLKATGSATLVSALPTSLIGDRFVWKFDEAGILYVSGLVKVKNQTTVHKMLISAGVQIGARVGNIWSVRIPLSALPVVCQSPLIERVELDVPLYPFMDKARETTRVDSVHAGFDLPYALTGKGVIVGFIDFGYDYTHPAFYDTSMSRYRVKRVWELDRIGTPPSGYTYGHELKDSAAILAQGTDNPAQYHGTAVAGCAAGSGFGSKPASDRFRGVAYESDLVFVGVRRDSIELQWKHAGFSDFLDGLKYIFDYAGEVQKPCVVNISWGSHTGAHDGSSLFSQACDLLSGPGRVIVMSAGNEGNERIHLDKSFSGSDTMIQTFLGYSNDTYRRSWIDLWGTPGQEFCVQVQHFRKSGGGPSTSRICSQDQIQRIVLPGAQPQDSTVIEIAARQAEANGKPHILLDVYSTGKDSVLLKISGTAGTVHAWNESYYYGYTKGYQSEFSRGGQIFASFGNFNSTVSDMGSGYSVILVGAYASKVNFTDINGYNRSYGSYVNAGNRVPFSSRGPFPDGRIKPDIMAPGLTLATASSSYYTSLSPSGKDSSRVVSMVDGVSNPNNQNPFYYAEFTGTSASSPVMAGIVALLLEVDPEFSHNNIKDIIFRTALEDNFSGDLPDEGNNDWGHGKINAYGAVKRALEAVGLPQQLMNQSKAYQIFPNPHDGNFYLKHPAGVAQNLQVRVLDVSGRVQALFVLPIQAGSMFTPVHLNNTGLTPGTYVLEFCEEGHCSRSKMMLY